VDPITSGRPPAACQEGEFPMPDVVCPLVVPDLGMTDVAWTVSVWLVPLGTHVVPGDRVVELLAGDATVDLAAPVRGVFWERYVLEDERVTPGQVIGLIKSRAE
jgi:pyruvate/2-oxoglutarate dehydrogenase complex dihydrolipoamide acyltransferase (E2) component